jgi:pyruvate kinase
MPRQTRIVATRAPASPGPEILERLIAAGVADVLSNNKGVNKPGHRSWLRLVTQGVPGRCVQTTHATPIDTRTP